MLLDQIETHFKSLDKIENISDIRGGNVLRITFNKDLTKDEQDLFMYGGLFDVEIVEFDWRTDSEVELIINLDK
jgi:hypothetical protein